MNPIAYDIMTYIRGQLNTPAFDSIRSASQEYGCLIEESDNVIDLFCNLESATVTISVKDNGMGQRGTAKAYDIANSLFMSLRMLMDVEINGTEYTRITTSSAPREVWGGTDSSVWRFTLSVDRAVEGITWQ